jgi:hypothetical protein
VEPGTATPSVLAGSRRSRFWCGAGRRYHRGTGAASSFGCIESHAASYDLIQFSIIAFGTTTRVFSHKAPKARRTRPARGERIRHVLRIPRVRNTTACESGPVADDLRPSA